jgi:hypothetical protein
MEHSTRWKCNSAEFCVLQPCDVPNLLGSYDINQHVCLLLQKTTKGMATTDSRCCIRHLVTICAQGDKLPGPRLDLQNEI